MKKLMRGHASQIFVRRHANRRRVRMLHASASRSFANVQDKRVPFEGRSLHQLYFILANALQLLFYALLLPIVPMNHDRHAWRHSGQIELFKFAELDGSVRESIVIRRFKEKYPNAACKVDPAEG